MHDIRKGICPLCEHTEVIEAIPAEFAQGGGEMVFAVTYDPRAVLAGRNPRYPHGPLCLYVCRACGYTQFFCESPRAVPIGDQFRTKLIQGQKPPGDGPYR